LFFAISLGRFSAGDRKFFEQIYLLVNHIFTSKQSLNDINTILIAQLSLLCFFHFGRSKLIRYIIVTESRSHHYGFAAARWTKNEEHIFLGLLNVISQSKEVLSNTTSLLCKTGSTFKILKPQTSS